MQDLDPSKPLVGEDGLEYEDLGDLLAGSPVKCERNEVIKGLREHPLYKSGGISWRELVYWQYDNQDRDGDRNYPVGRVDPQRLHLFAPSPGGPEGAGQPSAGQASADPVHAADQPAV